MAGNYFHDPRPFYGLGHTNLVPLDEVRDPKYDPSILKSPKSRIRFNFSAFCFPMYDYSL